VTKTMKVPIHILVVDDEPGIRAVLRQCLEGEGFVITEVGGKAGLFRALETEPVKLITLDLGLGTDTDGLQLAREIRAIRNVPIIMITGRGDKVDRVAGLEHGADDYITKPFHIREVVLRVRAVLARYGITGENTALGDTSKGLRLTYDAGVLDVTKRELRRSDDAMVDLTETEFRLLELFLKNPGRVLARDQICQLLRGHDWSPLDRAIDGHVARLRRKIEPPGEEPKLIRSVRGVGYVFAGEVKRDEGTATSSALRKTLAR
jgi:two-component system OmpR family response regulator